MAEIVTSKELGFGAAHPCMAIIKTEPDNDLPTYEAGFVATELVKASESISRVSGKYYADNKLSEKLDIFESGAIDFESKGFEQEIKIKIFGLTKNEDGEVIYNSEDEPPRIGFAYYRQYITDGKYTFDGIFYPKCQLVLGSDTAETRKDSITFASKVVTINIFETNTGDWKITKLCATKDEAIAWIHEKLGVV